MRRSKVIEGKSHCKRISHKVIFSQSTLKTHLDKVITRGFKPDVIIVDYADLLRPISRIKREKT